MNKLFLAILIAARLSLIVVVITIRASFEEKRAASRLNAIEMNYVKNPSRTPLVEARSQSPQYFILGPLWEKQVKN